MRALHDIRLFYCCLRCAAIAAIFTFYRFCQLQMIETVCSNAKLMQKLLNAIDRPYSLRQKPWRTAPSPIVGTFWLLFLPLAGWRCEAELIQWTHNNRFNKPLQKWLGSIFIITEAIAHSPNTKSLEQCNWWLCIIWFVAHTTFSQKVDAIRSPSPVPWIALIRDGATATNNETFSSVKGMSLKSKQQIMPNSASFSSTSGTPQ